MAGLWLHIDHDTPEKAELTQISVETGRSRGDAFLLLFKLWRWVRLHWKTGSSRGVTPQVIADVVGGDVDFWRAVERAGWLEFTADSAVIPGWDTRLSPDALRKASGLERQRRYRGRSAIGDADGDDDALQPRYANVTASVNKRDASDSESDLDLEEEDPRSDPIQRSAPRKPARRAPELTLTDLGNMWGEESIAILERAEEFFAKSGYSGADGKIFWQVAVLEGLKRLAPRFGDSALRACQVNAKGNPPAYFAKVIADECSKGGKDFAKLVRQVPSFPTGMKFGPPPRAAPVDPVSQFAAASKLPGDAQRAASMAKQREGAKRP